MTSYKVADPVKKWLQDEEFVLWCLLPTSESDEWQQNYSDSHPEEYEARQEARKIILSVRLNPVSRSSEETAALWHRIENSLRRKDFRRRMITFTRYAAASVLILCTIGIWMVFKNQPDTPEQNLIANIADNNTEITLIKDNAEIVEIENNAVITYDTAITIQVQDQTTKVLKDDHKEKAVKTNTLVVPSGRRASLVLADGSKVWINSGTTLHFPSAFEATERKIKVEGEIFIEVAPDASRPFYVETQRMSVSVLGTKFNVSAYASDSSQAIVLVEGRVSISPINSGESFILRPNQRFNLTSDTSLIDEVEVYDHISWIDGIFQFRGETMEEIAQRLSRYYNVRIICSPEIAQKRTAGKLMLFDRIEQVMETFAMLYGIKFTIENENIKIE